MDLLIVIPVPVPKSSNEDGISSSTVEGPLLANLYLEQQEPEPVQQQRVTRPDWTPFAYTYDEINASGGLSAQNVDQEESWNTAVDRKQVMCSTWNPYPSSGESGLSASDEIVSEPRPYCEQEEVACPPSTIGKWLMDISWQGYITTDQEEMQPTYRQGRDQEERFTPSQMVVAWTPLAFSHDEEEASTDLHVYYLEQQEPAYLLSHSCAVVKTTWDTTFISYEDIQAGINFFTFWEEYEERLTPQVVSLTWTLCGSIQIDAHEELASPRLFYSEDEGTVWSGRVSLTTTAWDASGANHGYQDEQSGVFYRFLIDDEAPYTPLATIVVWTDRVSVDPNSEFPRVPVVCDDEPTLRVVDISWCSRECRSNQADQDETSGQFAVFALEQEEPYSACQVVSTWSNTSFSYDETSTRLANIREEDLAWVEYTTSAQWYPYGSSPADQDESTGTFYQFTREEDTPWVAQYTSSTWVPFIYLDDPQTSRLVVFYREDESPWISLISLIIWQPVVTTHDEYSAGLGYIGIEEDVPSLAMSTPATVVRQVWQTCGSNPVYDAEERYEAELYDEVAFTPAYLLCQWMPAVTIHDEQGAGTVYFSQEDEGPYTDRFIKVLITWAPVIVADPYDVVWVIAHDDLPFVPSFIDHSWKPVASTHDEYSAGLSQFLIDEDIPYTALYISTSWAPVLVIDEAVSSRLSAFLIEEDIPYLALKVDTVWAPLVVTYDEVSTSLRAFSLEEDIPYVPCSVRITWTDAVVREDEYNSFCWLTDERDVTMPPSLMTWYERRVVYTNDEAWQPRPRPYREIRLYGRVDTGIRLYGV